MGENEYIDEIEKKLDLVPDPRLRMLIEKLINDRIELENVVQIDPLTGVYNRRILDKVRDYSVVVMIDVDNFKYFNDAYGHDAGDAVLKQVASVLINNVRLGDVVCRFGGDEFAVIFNNCSLDVVYNRMIKVEKALSNIEDYDIKVTLSIGISDRKENECLDDTLKNADTALYESKANGRNAISVYGNKSKMLSLK